MSAFLTYFADQIPSSISQQLAAIGPELVVFGVFILSYFLWHGFLSVEARRRAARKLQGNGASPVVAPKKPYSAPALKISRPVAEAASAPGEVVVARARSDAQTKAFEGQILKHLEQHEFTRALNLYRSARPDSDQRFSEQFYTAFIESAVRVGKTDVAERLFGALRRSGMVPSSEFWQRVLKVLSSRKHFSICLSVHSAFKHQLPVDKVVWSCLANAALEVGEAQRAASMLEQYSKTDLNTKDHILFFRTYNALKDADAAEEVFRKLGAETSPLMLNLLLFTCVSTGQAERALRILHEAHSLEDEAKGGAATLADTISYNTVIKGLAHAGKHSACLECLRGMLSRGLQPDDVTFSTMLDTCIGESAVGMIGEIVKVSLESQHHVGTIMNTLFIKGLVKADCLPKALELYEEMKRKASARPDVITYSVLIKALVDQHDLDRAVELLEDLKAAGHAPDDIILTHLLEGCRHAGDFELGKKLFTTMLADGIKPSEFTLVSMLKLCGRVGAHQEAHDLVAGWESTYGQKPSVIHFTCLMSGCLRRKQYGQSWAAYELMRANGVRPDSTTLSTLLPGMVAAQSWDRCLVIAKEALALPVQYKIPPETLNSALAQMQAADGYARQAAEFRELMLAAGVPIACRRVQQGRRSSASSQLDASARARRMS